MRKFKSNGKLLLTGEYLILDGALSIALPCIYGQSLEFNKKSSNQIIWKSFNHNHELWFSALIESEDLKLIETNDQSKAEWLIEILQNAKDLSNDYPLLHGEFNSHLEFPNKWGLGSSSTLINNIAQLFNVDPFELHFKCSNGSGYDIACASSKGPITYRLINNKPEVKNIEWNPMFHEDLFFIHLNKKQNSKNEVNRYEKLKINPSYVKEISDLSIEIIKCKSLINFEKLIEQHEKLISYCTKQDTVKNKYFSNYQGAIKSLGAWGGDFILATRNDLKYFEQKGFRTILPFNKLIKSSLN